MPLSDFVPKKTIAPVIKIVEQDLDPIVIKKPAKKQDNSAALAYLDSAMINLSSRKMNGKKALLQMLQNAKDLLT